MVAHLGNMECKQIWLVIRIIPYAQSKITRSEQFKPPLTVWVICHGMFFPEVKKLSQIMQR